MCTNCHEISLYFLILYLLNMTYNYSNKPSLSFKISKLYWLLGNKKMTKTAVKYIYKYKYLFSSPFPANSSCNKLLLTHNFPTCLSKILHSFLLFTHFLTLSFEQHSHFCSKMVSFLRSRQQSHFSACCLFSF